MMKGDLARKHLDRRLSQIRSADSWDRPPRGWIRAIRDALGMTAAQLAERMGVSQPRVFAMEKAEARDAVTIETLRRAAEALDCTLVYALVPNSSLDGMVRERARVMAAEQLGRVDHTMRLENQGVESGALADERDRLAGEIVRSHLSRLWDSR
jgi:predicted DNA-binding mobile mystery protein A